MALYLDEGFLYREVASKLQVTERVLRCFCEFLLFNSLRQAYHKETKASNDNI